MTKVGVVFGGPSPEHDISILTGLQAARSLAGSGKDIVCLYWAKSGRWFSIPLEYEAASFLNPDLPGALPVELSMEAGFLTRRLKRASSIRVDVVLNCCHGGPGEDGVLTGMLSLAGMRVTGPYPQGAALSMDKLAVNALARSLGIPSIESALITGASPLPDLPSGPWLAKPRFGGSSLGVEANIEDRETLIAMSRSGVARSGLLVQPYLAGWHDLNVAVRQYPNLSTSAIERPTRREAAYSYDEKYIIGGSGMDSAPRELPALIPTQIDQLIREYAVAIVAACGLHGAPRVDFLWDGDQELVLCEVNAIPGAWANHLWLASGVSRQDLYSDLVDEALSFSSVIPQWIPSSDGRALRASGSIAAKLG